jgi:hypothetical protein
MAMPRAPAPIFKNSLEYLANWPVDWLQIINNIIKNRVQQVLVLRTTEVNTINLI